MVKMKFKFIFKNRIVMRDYNKHRTLKSAKNWARSHNRTERNESWKIIKVLPIKSRRRR